MYNITQQNIENRNLVLFQKTRQPLIFFCILNKFDVIVVALGTIVINSTERPWL